MSVFDALAAARFVHFAAAFAMFGGALFWLYAFASPRQGAEAAPRSLCATRALLRVATLVLLASGLAWLAATVADIASEGEGLDLSTLRDPGTWRTFFVETAFGPPWALRLAAIAAAVAVAWAPGPPAFRPLALIGAALLSLQGLVGHAAQGGASVYGFIMLAVYAAHLCGAAAWAGGLPPLLFALAEIGRRKGRGDPQASPFAVLSRYSAMAVVAAPLAVVTGAANTWFRAGGAIAALASDAYGRILLTKLALVAGMLTLACLNRFILMPRLREATGVAGRALFMSVSAELALSVFVLAAAAVLGLTPPPQ